MGGFEAAEAWRALEDFLTAGEVVVGYVELDTRRWFETYPDAAGRPSWSALRGSAQDAGAGRATYGSGSRTARRSAVPSWSRSGYGSWQGACCGSRRSP